MDGTRKDATELDEQNNATTLNWRYDDDGRLVTETRDTTDAQGGDYIATYAYDLNGNRLKHQVDDDPSTSDITAFLAGGTFNADRTIAYDYNADDQLWRETGTGTDAYQTLYGHYDVQDSNLFHKGYDANGSLVEKVRTGSHPETVGYQYDLRNRLVRVDASGNTQYAQDGTPLPPADTGGVDTAADDTTYIYDSDGNRVGKVESTGTTIFVNDLANPTGYSQVLEERDGATGELNTTYVIGYDVIGQARSANADANALEYLLYDGHGSTRGLFNAQGGVLERYSFDAFGVALSANPPAPLTTLLYSGEQWDSEKASYFLRGRPIYDPSIGRFTSLDPLQGSTQEYAYADNDPVQRVDPSGLASNFPALLGDAVHEGISELYAADYPGHSVTFNKSPSGLGAIRPDIVDFTSKEIGEIKPVSLSGIALGAVQLPTYLGLYNGATLTYKGNSLSLPAVNGGGWKPSTWNVGVRVVPMPLGASMFQDWIAFTLGNAFGLILYKAVNVKSLTWKTVQTLERVAEQIEELGKEVTRAVQTSVQSGSASNNLGMLAAYDQQIDTAIHISLIGATGASYSKSVNAAGLAGLGAALGIAGLLAVLGRA